MPGAAIERPVYDRYARGKWLRGRDKASSILNGILLHGRCPLRNRQARRKQKGMHSYTELKGYMGSPMAIRLCSLVSWEAPLQHV